MDNESENVGEKIKYWYYNVTDLLELDFAHYLQSLPNETEPVFGYKSKCFGAQDLGVYAIWFRSWRR